MCTKIGHISREEVAPEPDQQEWTVALSFVQDRDTRKCLEKAHEASLDKEQEITKEWFDKWDDQVEIVQQLRTQLADSKNTARYYRELFNEIRLAVRGLISVDATKHEIINRVKSLVSQVAAEKERAEHNADVADSIARASKQVEDSLRTQLAKAQAAIKAHEELRGFRCEVGYGDTSALDAATQKAYEKGRQDERDSINSK